MLKWPLPLPLVVAIAAVLATFVGTELWLHNYDFANVRFRLPTINRFQEPDSTQSSVQDDSSCFAKDGGPTLYRGTDYYKSDLSR